MTGPEAVERLHGIIAGQPADDWTVAGLIKFVGDYAQILRDNE